MSIIDNSYISEKVGNFYFVFINLRDVKKYPIMKYFSCRSSRKIKKPNTRVHSNRTISLKLSCNKKSHRSSNCDLRTIKHKFDQVVILCFLIKEKRYTVFHNNYTSQNDNQQLTDS